MICPECKSKFNFVDRIKSMNKKNCKIQCRNCKNIFVKKKNSGRLVSSLVTGVLIFISSLIGSSLGRQHFENSILVGLIVSLIVAVILFIFYFISQNWYKYERNNDDLGQ